MNNKITTYLCFGILFLFSVVLTMMSPLLPYIAQSFELDITQSGAIFSANFIGFIIFTLAGGIIADRFNKKRVIFIALTGISISLGLLPLSKSFYAICIATAFIGGFGGVIESLVSAWIGDLNRERQSFYINLSGVFFGLGALLGPLAVGVALSAGVNWSVCYYFTGGLALLLAAAAWFGKADEAGTSAGINTAGIKAIFSNSRFLLACLCMLLYTGSEIGSWGWMCTFLKDNMEFSILKSSAALGLFWAAMTVGRLIFGFMTLRFDTRDLIIALSGTSAAITLFSGLVQVEMAVWIVVVLMGISYSAQWNLILAFGGECSKSSTGTAFAVLVASGGLGGMVIPYAMGLLAKGFGMRMAMSSPAILLLIVALVFIRIKSIASNSQREGVSI
ncbi:MAG TPA: MFS transporter [Candidatus Nitrosocosmicus sp.]|nr:MFS transporter [Candidatus Nitrosocosmicus sp.]